MALGRSRAFRLKFFRMEQRVEKIGAERHGDAQANDRFIHDGAPLETPTRASVKAHYDQYANSQSKVDKVKHVELPLTATGVSARPQTPYSEYALFLTARNMGLEGVRIPFEFLLLA